MKYFLVLFTIFVFITTTSTAQQTVRGKVVDSESKYPLFGVNVFIKLDSVNVIGNNCDFDGNYILPNVPIGKHTLQISYIGYQSKTTPIEVKSAKEVVLNLELEESSEKIDEVIIVGVNSKNVRNDMALASTRVFSVEETERYAGSRGDPARMASNFAGVGGADDSRNDIVVRGNSPLGVIYRVEGVDIPNPNHFAISGSTGGPVSILNNKLLSNSDFFTGAFPAEYGNSTAGVFDLKLRAGNNAKHEFTGQFGFLGTEIMAEGPLNSKKSSSYLLMYRYSTVSMFSALGIDIGTSAVPKYQDLSFKFNFPLSNGGNLAWWTISGKSDIDILISNQKDPEEIDLYGDNDRDQYFGTAMVISGLTYTKPLNETTYLKTTISGSLDHQHAKHEKIYRHVNTEGLFKVDSISDLLGFNFNTTKYALSTILNKKINKKNTLKAGINIDIYQVNLKDSIYKSDNSWLTRWNANDGFGLIQPFVQWKHKFSSKLNVSFGLHSQYFSLSDSWSYIEPRLGIKWNLNDKNTFSFGAGQHSQTQPIYTYYYLNQGNENPHNTKMDFSRSNHLILGYKRSISKNLMINLEAYYQQLTSVPISNHRNSFSLINQGSGFSRIFPSDTLINEGEGENYGLEFTLQKFYFNSWHFMITGAIYESKYRGGDGIVRDTDFNGNFAANFLIGKDFTLSKNRVLGIGAKITYAGGKRYGYLDNVASEEIGEVIYLDAGYNTLQFKEYFRIDAKINYKKNGKKVTHEIGLDLVNLLGTQNILGLTYAPVPGDPNIDPIRENYQLGFLPVFFYRLDF